MSPCSRLSAGPRQALLRISGLSRHDWALLLGALILLPLVSAGLRLFGLRRVLVLIAAIPAARRCVVADGVRGATRTAWLVDVAARGLWPRPACLAKAVVVSSFLRRRGRAAQLVVGVAKTGGTLEGHAWVELGGAAVGASHGLARYAVLARIPDRPPDLATFLRAERTP